MTDAELLEVAEFLYERHSLQSDGEARHIAAVAERLLDLLPPADDGEAVTADWLDRHPALADSGGGHWRFGGAGRWVSVTADRGGLVCRVSDGDTTAFLPAGCEPHTRGRFNHLLAALTEPHS